MTTQLSPELIGVGLYTVGEAARLIAESPARLRRWLAGYQIAGAEYPALWLPQIDMDDGLFLGFRDLMQARVASALVAEGLTPQKVRKATRLAAELTNHDRPLATSQFKTDGCRVFLLLSRGDDTDNERDDRLIDLFSGQDTFKRIVEPSLRAVDFDADGRAERWWPQGRRGRVVLDPKRSFGQPIDDETSVPVSALADAVLAEGSVQMAAKAFEVPAAAVARAVEFVRGEKLARAA